MSYTREPATEHHINLLQKAISHEILILKKDMEILSLKFDTKLFRLKSEFVHFLH